MLVLAHKTYESDIKDLSFVTNDGKLRIRNPKFRSCKRFIHHTRHSKFARDSSSLCFLFCVLNFESLFVLS